MTEDQRDCLQEIINVAMGQAGESLARLIEMFVKLGVPSIHLASTKDIMPKLKNMFGEQHDSVTAVRQMFNHNSGKLDIQGEAILVFSQSSLAEIEALMVNHQSQALNNRMEFLLNIANILTGVSIKGIADQLDSNFNCSPPSLIGMNISTEQLQSQDPINWHEALIIEVTYRLEHQNFTCSLLFLMAGDSIAKLLSALDDFLEQL